MRKRRSMDASIPDIALGDERYASAAQCMSAGAPIDGAAETHPMYSDMMAGNASAQHKRKKDLLGCEEEEEES